MLVEYSMTTMPIGIDTENCHSIMTARAYNPETNDTMATCEVYFVDFFNGMNVTDCHDLLDVDGVTYEFVELFTTDFELTSEIALKLDHYIPIYRLVIIHGLQVGSEHRGNKLSNALISDIERRFVCDTDLLALKAFPLDNNTPETTESLTKYYESIGFQRTGVNDILTKPQF
ncbi:hypothetical protein P3551_20915 [Vibrio parahaemolyticus]|uniref:hypothetical protein n=1 Tax=Vibrio parahaemolyticus TaxID=670 RepID=UPI0011213479|nr:hypothetical protein [Vibrio parahaemolyticus]MBE4286469.1 hypothetical protein [Vibrio parahaemolyticus]MDF4901743.1 hypothetical protein [Vibrio parahaemolyticus]TOH18960.1 hypothetical protein CGI90_04375 [Vibrio parahaemolyticus]HCG8860039.1 hypothetical protein [Vibrio parahaemolyticus]HCH1183525.1 hypothetical protein [Vibrio parahaemolyticus]